MKLLLPLVFLIGCAARIPAPTKLRGPDGTPHWFITCAEGRLDCYLAANRNCPVGYEIVDAVQSADDAISADIFLIGLYKVNYRHTLLVKCKEIR